MIIRRGYVIYDDNELIQRLHRPDCLRVLRILTQFYEARARRLRFEELIKSGTPLRIEYIMELEHQSFLDLIRSCDLWLAPPLRIDFGEQSENR